jgi:hypothetical protein
MRHAAALVEALPEGEHDALVYGVALVCVRALIDGQRPTIEALLAASADDLAQLFGIVRGRALPDDELAARSG